MLLYYNITVENACEIDNGGCEQMCTNINGFAECSCTEGFNLSSNNFDCEGRDGVSSLDKCRYLHIMQSSLDKVFYNLQM